MATNLLAGNYSVIVTSANGCIGTGTASIQQPPLLDATVTSVATCPGVAQGSFSASVNGGTPGYTYLWNTTPVQTTAIVTGMAAGRYLLKVTDSKGCVDTVTATINTLPAPQVDAGANQEVCSGSSAQLTARGAQSYSWFPTTSLSCGNCASPAGSPTTNTTYTVIGIDANGCQASDTVSIKVVQHTPVSVDEKRTICEGDSVRLNVTGGIDWEWLSPASAKGTKNPFVKPNATTTYYVIVTENQCFQDTLSQKVEVLPIPTIDLGEDLVAAIGSTVHLNADVTNAVSISWSPATGLSCSDCFTPEFQVRGKATYVARVTNALGCAATDTVRIQDICDDHSFFFPNVFTPNGDGSNDRFYPQGMSNYQVQHFMIYNRWGEVVFSASNIAVNDASAGWDGTFKGDQLKPDVYVYVMDAQCQNGQKVIMRGDITLIR
jgi:gliding motility-associated-like protein